MPNDIEYRELFSLNSVLLSIEDLQALEELLIEDSNTDRLEITVTTGSTTIRKKSVAELLDTKGLPQKTDRVQFGMTRWIDTPEYRGISSGAHLSMNYNHVQCQIHSIDQTWFLGKKTQVKEYCAAKKPWYQSLSKLSVLYPSIAMALLFYSASMLSSQQYMEMIFPVATAILLIAVTILVVQQRLFPYVTVWLKPKKAIDFGFNEACALISALGAIGTLVQLFSNLYS